MNPVYTAHPVSLRLIPIVSCHLRRSLPNGLFPEVFQIELFCTALSSATCLAHPIPLYLISLLIKNVAFRSVIMCSFVSGYQRFEATYPFHHKGSSVNRLKWC
jgi:hypothetical protein